MNSLLWRAVLHVVECLAASLASLSSSQWHLPQPKMSPDIAYCPLGGQITPIEKCCLTLNLAIDVIVLFSHPTRQVRRILRTESNCAWSYSNWRTSERERGLEERMVMKRILDKTFIQITKIYKVPVAWQTLFQVLVVLDLRVNLEDNRKKNWKIKSG